MRRDRDLIKIKINDETKRNGILMYVNDHEKKSKVFIDKNQKALETLTVYKNRNPNKTTAQCIRELIVIAGESILKPNKPDNPEAL